MKKTKCCVSNMKDFFDNFHPATHKYQVFGKLDDYPTEISALGAKFDSSFRYGPLNKKEFRGIFDNLYLVYGNPEIIKKDIQTYYSVEKKIIKGYLTLPLIDMMFDEDYFEFEWDMHVGQNFRTHRSDYYRDHFIHQARNMFMMHQLLEDHFFEPAKCVLANKHNSKISEYCCLKLSQFMLDKESKEYQLFGEMVDSITEYTTIASPEFFDDIDTYRNYYDPINKCRSISEISADDYAYHYFYKYIIYASSYLCALFHDMGYPICHFLEVRERLSNYNPAMYMITQNISGSFDNIAAKLSDSLLFTIVSHEEIQKRMNARNSSGHLDHGVYSAIAFLLHFYETGACQRLTPEKQCAIELAAIAIYNHTQKYACSETDDAAKCSYYQPIFKQNPISFLLHYCDDLQEWDRKYFEISDTSAYSICSSCHGVLMPHSTDNPKGDPLNRSQYYLDAWDNNVLPVERFDCFCSNVEGANSFKCFRRQTFNKRQIYLVTATPTVSFELNQSSKILNTEIQYDLFRLLQMSHINPNYAKFRLKDLRELKCRLHDQKFKLQCDKFGFNSIYIDTFISSNPILIKVKMIEKYIQKKIFKTLCQIIGKEPELIDLAGEYSNAIITLINKYNINFEESVLELTICDCIKWIIETMDMDMMADLIRADIISTPSTSTELSNKICINEQLYNYLFYDPTPNQEYSRLDFYITLLFLSVNTQYSKSCDKSQIIGDFINVFQSIDDSFYNNILTALIQDCIYQYSRERKSYESVGSYIIKREKDNSLDFWYHNIYIPNPPTCDMDMYDIVNKYCHADNSFNKYYKTCNEFYIGYYGDLFFFEQLNDKLYY